ncbi:MAG: PAS domain-containing sensor histidine kinase, partial [Candidatus Paraprevotella stercoravium]|nr:PAS domain-containing sensor histidine kinase [Candidatus Paraprevotella stercoravium]
LSLLAINLYRMQIKQTKMLQRIVECVQSQSLSEKIHAPFETQAITQIANQLNTLLQSQKEKMQKEESRFLYYNQLLQEVDTALIVTDNKGIIEWYNHSAENLFGQQMYLPEYIHQGIVAGHDVIHYEKDSRQMDLALSQNRMLVQGRECRIISLKNLHGTLNRTEMEAWQKLIRVLTHEIMNSITPIISLSDTLCERSNEGPLSESVQQTLQQGLGIIHRRCKGLMEFVQNYRKLTRIAPPVKVPIGINAFLKDLQRLVGGTDIRFTDDTPAGSVWHADRGQMEQVFLNLLKNAREACRNCPEPEIIVRANKQKERIIFTIKDNGEGILPEVRERIFVPFFTTKPNGSGIGLSLCRQIITLHDGSILVHSEPGSGSEFVLEFTE